MISNKIKLMLRPLLFVCIFFFAKNAVADNVIHDHDLPLQPGGYMTATFIEALKKTRSPFYAVKHSDYPPNITITYDEKLSNYIYFTGFDFRSGLDTFKADKALKNITSTSPYARRAAKVPNWSHTTFSFLSNWQTLEGVASTKKLNPKVSLKKVDYVYVGNLNRFINRNTIAGKYKDSEGRLYIFTEEGKATFPERSFSYEVVLDPAVGDFDSFITDVRKAYGFWEHFAFKVDKDTLQLFNIISEDANDEPESSPFVTLMRVAEEMQSLNPIE